jgi:oxygen-dependent protoporphyrinogen oxidase
VKVAVIGGGIAGLAAAWELRDRAEVTLFEPDRLGGRIRTTPFEGRRVDEGADAFLTRVPEAVQLCQELGLGPELVAPAAGRSMIWWEGRLRPLPDGLVLGVPRQLGGLLGRGILSPRGTARAALDLVLPRGRPPAQLTVRELVADRFGAEVADRLVDPLVGSIHAGWTGNLGAAEVVPQLVNVAERSRSLLLGLRSAANGGNRPPFLTPRGGLGQLVDALGAGLADAGARVVGVGAQKVRPAGSRQVVVDPDPDPYDGAVVATPALVTARILGCAGTEALAALPTASVALVTAALPGTNLPEGINGFLVPREEGRYLTACSFASNKWPHWSAPGRALVRMSAGRHGDDAALDLDDLALVDRLIDELSAALRSPLSPSAARVSRWPDAFPQYLPGHARRMAAVAAAVAQRFPTVMLAGAAYRGSGIPACIASGRSAAGQVLDRISSSPASRSWSPTSSAFPERLGDT